MPETWRENVASGSEGIDARSGESIGVIPIAVPPSLGQLFLQDQVWIETLPQCWSAWDVSWSYLTWHKSLFRRADFCVRVSSYLGPEDILSLSCAAFGALGAETQEPQASEEEWRVVGGAQSQEPEPQAAEEAQPQEPQEPEPQAAEEAQPQEPRTPPAEAAEPRTPTRTQAGSPQEELQEPEAFRGLNRGDDVHAEPMEADELPDFRSYARLRQLCEPVVNVGISVFLPMDSHTWKHVPFRKIREGPRRIVAVARRGFLVPKDFPVVTALPDGEEEDAMELLVPVEMSDCHLVCYEGRMVLMNYTTPRTAFILKESASQDEIALSVPVSGCSICSIVEFSSQLYLKTQDMWDELVRDETPCSHQSVSPSPRKVRAHQPDDRPSVASGGVLAHELGSPESRAFCASAPSTSPGDEDLEDDDEDWDMSQDPFVLQHSDVLRQQKHLTTALMTCGRHPRGGEFGPPTDVQAVPFGEEQSYAYPFYSPFGRTELEDHKTQRVHPTLGRLTFWELASALTQSEEYRGTGAAPSVQRLREEWEQMHEAREPEGFDFQAGMVADVTFHLSRKGTYYAGEPCPVKRWCEATHRDHVEDGSLEVGETYQEPNSEVVRCGCCSGGVVEETCRPLVRQRLSRYRFVLECSPEEMPQCKRQEFLSLTLDLMHKGQQAMPFMRTGEQAEVCTPIAREGDEELFEVLGAQFDDAMVPTDLPQPNRFHMGYLEGVHLAQAPPLPSQELHGIRFGSGELDFDAARLTSQFPLGPLSRKSARQFLLGVLSEGFSESQSMQALRTGIQQGAREKGTPWKALWRAVIDGETRVNAEPRPSWPVWVTEPTSAAKTKHDYSEVIYHRREDADSIIRFQQYVGVGPWSLASRAVWRAGDEKRRLVTPESLTTLNKTRMQQISPPSNFTLVDIPSAAVADDDTKNVIMRRFAPGGVVNFLDQLRWCLGCSLPELRGELSLEDVPLGVPDDLYTAPTADVVAGCTFCGSEHLQSPRFWGALKEHGSLTSVSFEACPYPRDTHFGPSAIRRDGATRYFQGDGVVPVLKKGVPEAGLDGNPDHSETSLQVGNHRVPWEWKNGNLSQKWVFGGKEVNACIFPASAQFRVLHLLGVAHHVRHYRDLAREDFRWVLELGLAMRQLAASIGVEGVTLFFHEDISVNHLHLHAIDSSKYQATSNDVLLTEVLKRVNTATPPSGMELYVQRMMEEPTLRSDLALKFLAKWGEHVGDLLHTEYVGRARELEGITWWRMLRICNSTYSKWGDEMGIGGAWDELSDCDRGNFCEGAIALAFLNYDRTCIRLFVARMLELQSQGPEQAQYGNDWPHVVGSDTSGFIQPRHVFKALQWEPNFIEVEADEQAPVCAPSVTASRSSGEQLPRPRVRCTHQAPPDLPAWIEWMEPQQALFGCVGETDWEGMERAKRAGFELVECRWLFSGVWGKDDHHPCLTRPEGRAGRPEWEAHDLPLAVCDANNRRWIPTGHGGPSAVTQNFDGVVLNAKPTGYCKRTQCIGLRRCLSETSPRAQMEYISRFAIRQYVCAGEPFYIGTQRIHQHGEQLGCHFLHGSGDDIYQAAHTCNVHDGYGMDGHVVRLSERQEGHMRCRCQPPSEKPQYDSKAGKKKPTQNAQARLVEFPVTLQRELAVSRLRRRLEEEMSKHWGKKICYICHQGRHRSTACAIHSAYVVDGVGGKICMFTSQDHLGNSADYPFLSHPVPVCGGAAQPRSVLQERSPNGFTTWRGEEEK